MIAASNLLKSVHQDNRCSMFTTFVPIMHLMIPCRRRRHVGNSSPTGPNTYLPIVVYHLVTSNHDDIAEWLVVYKSIINNSRSCVKSEQRQWVECIVLTAYIYNNCNVTKSLAMQLMQQANITNNCCVQIMYVKSSTSSGCEVNVFVTLYLFYFGAEVCCFKICSGQ